MHSQPIRPQMPTAVEQQRSEHQGARYDMLDERSDDLIREWMKSFLEVDRLDMWGPPDTSACPLVSFAAQASRPGLYVKRPMVRGPAGSEGLVGEQGLVDMSGLWSMMQTVQYFTVGLNSMAVKVGVSSSGKRLTYRPVHPHNIFALARADEPRVPVEIWELRLRTIMDEGSELPRQVYTWDVWSIADPANPIFAVYEAMENGGKGPDITADLGVPNLRRLEGKSGDAMYPYWRGDTPVLPWVIYRAVEDGTMWAWNRHRSAFRGSLNTMMSWSQALNAARDASGNTRFMFDAEPLNAKSAQGLNGQATNRLTVQPGTTHMFRTRDNSPHQAKVQSVGPGAELQSLVNFAQVYEGNVHVRMGLNPTDITRTNNTPTTGVAIALSNADRRALQEQYAPLFHRADTELLGVSAVVAGAHGLGQYPTEGYSISYEPLRLLPAEEQSRREELDWRVERNLMSPTERYRKLHPGSTKDDAIDAMVDAIAEKQLIAKRVAQLTTPNPADNQPTTDPTQTPDPQA